MRIVLIGTEKKLARPSRAQLQLDNWNNSYLDWVDLSGLAVPLMRDADVFHYCANSKTVFQNTDWTQFRFPVDADGNPVRPEDHNASWPADLSSYNHDGVVTIMGQATNASHPGNKLVRDHVSASYNHSWQDSIYRLRHELGMSLAEIHEVLGEAFAGYPVLLSRLTHYDRDETLHPEPPDSETRTIKLSINGEWREIDLSGRVEFIGYDRYKMNQNLGLALRTEQGFQHIYTHITQIHPHRVVFAVTNEGINPDKEGWWQARWRS